jgi:hypothetical protein
MESTKNILTTDENRNWGLELLPTDLLQCHVNQQHDGNVYVCPLVSPEVVLKNVLNTFLGALYFGDKSTALQLCQQLVRKQEETNNFAVQTRLQRMMFFSYKNKSLIESCTNGMKQIIHASRLTGITTSLGCRIISDTFILKFQQIIEKLAEVFERPNQFK